MLGWRELPTDADGADLGPTARRVMPTIRQLFVAGAAGETGLDLERRTFCLRKRAEHATEVYFPSLSPRTIVYKGMLSEPQVEAFYPDLSDERVVSALALVHSRFSTNTFPAWPLAHPYRYVAHNGEINTLRGNRNWMAAREALLASDLIPGDLARLSPIVTPDASDSATFDEVLELLHLGGRSLPHAVLMMIPEAWENHAEMDPARRAFYEFHATLMEPWDGPALVAFTDGTVAGAVLDRNGLRPARYWVTEDGLVALASEVGVLDVEPSDGRAQGPPRARPHVPGRHGGGQARRRRGDQGRAGRRAPLRGVAALRPDPPRRPGRPRARGAQPRRAHPAPAVVRLHRGGAERPAQADGRQRGGADRLDGQRRAARRDLGAAPAAVRLLQPAVRAGHQPAVGRDPRGAGHLARQPARPGAEPARRQRGALPHDHAARAGAHQRRPRPHRAHQRRRRLPRLHLRHRARHVPRRRRRRGAEGAPAPDLHAGVGGHRRRRAADRALPARRHQGLRADPVAAAHRRRPPAPHPRAHPHPRRAGRRGGRRPRGAPHRPAHRLRGGRGQPLPGDGHGRGPRDARRHQGHRLRDGGQEPGQGAGQGRAQDHVEDRHLHGGVLHRRADLRGGRPRPRGDRHLLHRHHLAARRRRLRRARRGGAHPPPPGVPVRRDPGRAPRAGGRRRVPVAARGRAAPVQPDHRVQAPALHPAGPVRDLQGVHARRRRAGAQAHDPARALPVQERHPPAGRHRRGRAGRRDRQAVRHRRDLLRVDLQGDARDPRHRDEPPRRQVQHRRGRRGRRPLHPRRQRRQPPQRDQAGRVRPVRRHQRVPGQRRRPADQDQPGRQAGRGRPAARRQGLPVDREDPATPRRASG